jgi:hypothetical protein
MNIVGSTKEKKKEKKKKEKKIRLNHRFLRNLRMPEIEQKE